MAKVMEIIARETNGKAIIQKSSALTQLVCHHLIMEEQIVSITVVTKGEKCEILDDEIIDWYRSNVAKLLNPEYGTPEITVT